MEIKIFQLLFIAFYTVVALFVWKIKNRKVKAGLLIFALIVFLFNPIKFNQGGMSRHEQRFNKQNIELPKKVIVETESFDSMQSRELKKLKKMSKETKNEAE